MSETERARHHLELGQLQVAQIAEVVQLVHFPHRPVVSSARSTDSLLIVTLVADCSARDRTGQHRPSRSGFARLPARGSSAPPGSRPFDYDQTIGGHADMSRSMCAITAAMFATVIAERSIGATRRDGRQGSR